MTIASAFAPATMANLGVGFDILGLAFDAPGDTVTATLQEASGVTVAQIEGDGGRLPLAADKNTAAVAAQSVLNAIAAQRGESRLSQGVALSIKKGLPLASGMGSSAASAVAAAVAVNALFGEPLSRAELLPACLDGEAVVSGYHADNVAPCLFGGVTLITGTTAQDILTLPHPAGLRLAVVTPNIGVPTAEARAVLPQQIPLKTMIAQTAGIAQLIDAFYRGDIPAIGATIEKDTVVEPARAHLMPYLAELRAAAKAAGAYGLTISGAGPTLCAICDSDAMATAVTQVMQTIYEDAGLGCVTRVARVSDQGASVIP